MIISGLDPSLTSFGMASSAGLGTVPLVYRCSPRTRGHERLAYLLLEVERWCHGSAVVIIEAPVMYGDHGDTSMNLAWLTGMVRHRLWELGIPYVMITPAVVKKFATGNHLVDKYGMVAEAVRRFGNADVGGSDTADALWLCAAGCQHYGQPIVRMPADRVAALDAVQPRGKRKGEPKVAWPEIGAAVPLVVDASTPPP